MLKKNKTKQKSNEDNLPYFKRLLKNGYGQKGRAEIKKLKLEREKLESEEFARTHYKVEPLSDEKKLYESPLDPTIPNY